jgi:hypothetical protein
MTLRLMETGGMCISIIKTMKLFAAVVLAFMVSCSQVKPGSDNTYRLPVFKGPVTGTEPGGPPPPPPPIYYLAADFIIDSAGQVYFYQQPHYRQLCGTGIENKTLPEFIDLQPEDLVRIPDNNIEEFIKENIVTLARHDRLVAIALMKDTITSSGLTKIFKVVDDTANNIRWIMRQATQEEAVVLAYKQQNRRYYPGNIEWDSSKIRYIPGLKNNIKFTTPEVEYP